MHRRKAKRMSRKKFKRVIKKAKKNNRKLNSYSQARGGIRL